jgi:hypothetical protein
LISSFLIPLGDEKEEFYSLRPFSIEERAFWYSYIKISLKAPIEDSYLSILMGEMLSKERGRLSLGWLK